MKMLVRNPNDRFTVKMLLNDQYLKNVNTNNEQSKVTNELFLSTNESSNVISQSIGIKNQ
jgi:hypothetical protein